MNKLFWFPLHTAEFLASTASMFPAETGAYIRLLCHQWEKGVLPKDPNRLARLAGCDRAEFPSVWELLREEFTETQEGFLNTGLEVQRERQAELSKLNSAKASKRWARDAAAEPQHMPADIPTDMPSACNQESESNPESKRNQERNSSSSSNPNQAAPIEDEDEFVLNSTTQTGELATRLWEAVGSPRAHDPSKWVQLLANVPSDWRERLPELIRFVSVSSKWQKYLSGENAKNPAAYFVSQLESIEADRARWQVKHGADRDHPVFVSSEPVTLDDVEPLDEQG